MRLTAKGRENLRYVEKSLQRGHMADDDDHDYAQEALHYIEEIVEALLDEEEEGSVPFRENTLDQRGEG